MEIGDTFSKSLFEDCKLSRGILRDFSGAAAFCQEPRTVITCVHKAGEDISFHCSTNVILIPPLNMLRPPSGYPLHFMSSLGAKAKLGNSSTVVRLLKASRFLGTGMSA